MASPFRKQTRWIHRRTPFQPTCVDYAHNLLLYGGLNPDDVRGHGRCGALVREMLRVTRGRGAAAEPSRRELSELVARFQKGARRSGREPRPPQSPLPENLMMVGQLFELDENERAILQFVSAMHAHPGLEELLDCWDHDAPLDLIAVATGIRHDQVRKAINPGGRLLRSGLVSVDVDRQDLTSKVDIKEGFLDALMTPGLERRSLVERYLPLAGESSLEWSDYAHMEVEARTLRDLLGAALRARRPGVNVLLYGPTGVGKTELAKRVVQELGCELYACGQADEDGDSATAQERLSSLRMGQSLVQPGSSLLLFDELEDLFTWDSLAARSRPEMSKQWFNLLLERNPVPTVWISNSTRGIDSAFLRRFAYAVEFRPLGAAQRTHVLTRHLAGNSRLTAADVESVTLRYASSAGLFATAVNSAQLIAADGAPDREQLERVLLPLEKLVSGREPVRHSVLDPGTYSLEALNVSDDLTQISERLARCALGELQGVSLLLYGKPGTGKSAYAAHLAQRMNRPLLCKRASDIFGPYLGQTEQAIANAFREAESDGAVLLFDEVDSFLYDRAGAKHSWQVAQVNEFLDQLAHSRGVVVCTTNLSQQLDDAARRRFTFSVEFRPLRFEQGVQLFERVFGRELARDWVSDSAEVVRAGLRGVTNLTPGDFALVARRIRTLGERWAVEEIVRALCDESRAKPGARKALGFEREALQQATS